MTKEEILAMEAGKELDHLVMTEIFKASLKYYGDEEIWHHFDLFGEPDQEWSCYNNPSSNISAAWEVIGEMQAKGFATVLQRQGDYFAPDDLWECQFGHKPMAKDESAQAAICKAALLAVMES